MVVDELSDGKVLLRDESLQSDLAFLIEIYVYLVVIVQALVKDCGGDVLLGQIVLEVCQLEVLAGEEQ